MIDVAVVGGGVVGAACALELARRGASVTVLERDRVGHGCSYGNAGWLTPSLALPLAAPGQIRKAARWLLDPESPFYVPLRPDPSLLSWLVRFAIAARRGRYERGAAALVALARDGVDAWESLARRTPGGFGFARAGLAAIFETAPGLAAGRAQAELVARFGIPSELWSADELRAHEPAVVGPQIGAVIYPRDAHCEPYAAMRALAAEAERAGAVFVEGREVLGAELAGETVRSLRTAAGPFEAREIVLAAGAWSGSLGRRFGLRIPVLGGKGYSLVLPRRDPHPTRSLYLAERKIAVNPHADALRVSGTLELVGEDLSIDARRVGAIVRGARRLLAMPEAIDTSTVWRGLRPCAPDGMPLIGRSRSLRNVWIASGHQMTGLKTAPATGRLIAELMSGEPPSLDPAPFRADRF